MRKQTRVILQEGLCLVIESIREPDIQEAKDIVEQALNGDLAFCYGKVQNYIVHGTNDLIHQIRKYQKDWNYELLQSKPSKSFIEVVKERRNG